MKPRYTNLKQRSYNTYKMVTVNNLPKVKIESAKVETSSNGLNGWVLVGVFVAGIIGKMLLFGMI